MDDRWVIMKCMVMIKDVDLSPINDLRDTLLSRLPGIIQRIVIYGSYARGEAATGSDIDVLVVLDDSSPSVIEEARAARYDIMAQNQYHPLLSLLLLSYKDWQKLPKHSAGLKSNIEKEGITVWSRI
ncbi:MAG: hypothetical protein MAG431_01720 [Chloroflexi bacterium]|nr:hypothetical protein [Chloroflexota bacterium]